MRVTPFEFRGLSQADAEAILQWQYEPPLDFYNANSEGLAALLDPGNCYFAVRNGGQIIGFCCFGADARVAGGQYLAPALDVGAGLRPDLIGRGMGYAFLHAVVDVAEQHAFGRPLRATVADFNARAVRAVKSVGFLEVARFRRPTDGVTFVMFLRDEVTISK